MLAPAELGAPEERAPERAEIVVGVHGGGDPEAAAETVERVREILAPIAQQRRSLVLVVGSGSSRRAGGDGHPSSPPGEAPRVPAGSGPLAALLATAQRLDASACALVTADPREGGNGYLEDLLGPVLHDAYDLVWPLYRRHKFEGGLHVALARPFAHAVFGSGLRQPITSELAFARRAVEYLSDDRELHEDAKDSGETLLAAHGISRAFASRGFKVGQAVLGSVPAAPPSGDVSDTVARIARVLFEEARRHAATWQRPREPSRVALIGNAQAIADDARPLDASRMFDAFAQGYRELHRLWSAVLPPATLLGLKRAAALPPETFKLDPALWARVVYDFAVGYRTAAMERRQMLRSMTPLYLGWMASWVNEVRDLPAAEVEERAERVCHAFDAERPYFMSRWRWPDRFAP